MLKIGILGCGRTGQVHARSNKGLDAAEVMAVADARVLASKVDRTVLAVRWAETRRDTVAMSLRHLAEIGAANIGVALTRVDARKHAHYARGDSGYYHRDHRGYYGRSRS